MKIVVSLPEKDNEYQVLQADEARTVAKRLGLEVEILYADNSAVVQIQQIFQAVRADPRPDAIVVEPVTASGMESALRKAVQAGIGSAFLNCTLGDLARLRAEFPQTPVFAVASDQVEIGRIQARQVRTLLPDGGTVLYVHGPQSATAARERFQGFAEVLQGSKVRPMVLDAQWTEESADAAVRKWLRLKTSEALAIDLVAAQDDSMARGARRAIRASAEVGARWARIPYLGIDGVPSVGQRLVDQGELTATIVMPSNTGPALEHVARWRRAGVMPPETVNLPLRPYPEMQALLKRPGGPA